MFGPIKTVGIYVEDQHKAKTFYLDTLGFTLRRELPMGSKATWLEVSPAPPLTTESHWHSCLCRHLL